MAVNSHTKNAVNALHRGFCWCTEVIGLLDSVDCVRVCKLLYMYNVHVYCPVCYIYNLAFHNMV